MFGPPHQEMTCHIWAHSGSYRSKNHEELCLVLGMSCLRKDNFKNCQLKYRKYLWDTWTSYKFSSSFCSIWDGSSIPCWPLPCSVFSVRCTLPGRRNQEWELKTRPLWEELFVAEDQVCIFPWGWVQRSLQRTCRHNWHLTRRLCFLPLLFRGRNMWQYDFLWPESKFHQENWYPL